MYQDYKDLLSAFNAHGVKFPKSTKLPSLTIVAHGRMIPIWEFVSCPPKSLQLAYPPMSSANPPPRLA